MSYSKLFELNTIGLSSGNIAKLFEKFNNLNIGAYVTKDELQKTITQKKLLDRLVSFLIDNKILEVIDENDELYRINISFPQTYKEKELEVYNKQKLYLSQKALLSKKLKSYINKIGYIIKIDLANSTSAIGNLKLKDILLNIEFPKFLKKSIEKFFYHNKGYLIANYGDEAFLFFFEKKDAKLYISKMIEEYKKDLYLKFKEYNKTIKDFNNRVYLKFFIANSTINNLTYDDYNLPSFENMLAMKYISRIEKPFKEQILKNNNINVEKFFIVSDIKLDDEFKEEIIESEDKESYKVFYKIDKIIKV